MADQDPAAGQDPTGAQGANGAQGDPSGASAASGAAAAGDAGAAQTPPQDNQVAYYRRQAEKAQKELEAHKKAQMTEADRTKLERDEANKRAEAAEKRAADVLLQTRFELAASKARCHDPEAAFALADHGALTVDDSGKVLGVDRALESLKKAKPYLFGAAPKPSVGTGGGNPGAGPAPTANQRMNDWIRRAAGFGGE